MAQQGAIIPTAASPTFPGCALSCATLLQAQTFCLPPSIPQSNQLTYDQCFCQSAFLTPFATTPDGVCVAECVLLADRQILQNWYKGFCAQVRQGIDPTTLTSTSISTSNPAASNPATTIATATVTATSGTVTATVAPTTSSSGSHTPANQTWIEGHWKWILMVAVLAVGLGLLAWLAIWLKRRHRRKIERQRAAASGFTYDPEKRPPNDPRRSATPDLWGPHQMMQATQGYGYATDEVMQENEKPGTKNYRGAESSTAAEKDVIEFAEPIKGVKVRPSNRRARPSELEINARMIGAADRRSKKVRSRSGSRKPSDKEIEAGSSEPRKPKTKPKMVVSDPEKT